MSHGHDSAVRILRDETSSCIDHGKNSCNRGYAVKKHQGRCTSLHRFVYCIHHGLELKEIAGLVVRHTCDNKRCINPDHLLLGTHADNMRDVSLRRRSATIKLTDAQVLEIRATCKPSKVGGFQKPNPYSYTELAKKFGVSDAAVRAAHLRVNFRHTCLGETNEPV